MDNNEQLTRKKPSGTESYYFDLQATWGLTKHMGGLNATRELIELGHIGKNSYVLDVGCGVGITACYMAGEYGCRVVGIDLSEMMVRRSKERARRKKVEDKVEFRVADAQELPFMDNLFDAVIIESVNAFMDDKQKAANEYKRVTKKGGYVGFNEVTWIEAPPPELVEYLSRALGGAKFLTCDGWKDLLEKVGLTDILAKACKTTAWRQWANEVKQMDPGDYLRAWGRFLSLCFKSPATRKYLKEIIMFPKSIFKIFKYFGYGIYVGRK